jgi:hypothetical protein
LDLNSHSFLSSDAPENSAETNPVDELTFTPRAPDTRNGIRSAVAHREEVATETINARHLPSDEIIARLKSEIEPGLMGAAARAAAQATRCEIERTRTWFETKALPKAVRVAQSECYSLLKKHGSLDEKSQRLRAGLGVGRRAPSGAMETSRLHTPEEVNEWAEVCLALLDAQGQAIEVTLSEMSAASGGWMLPEDAPQVRAAAEQLLSERERRG